MAKNINDKSKYGVFITFLIWLAIWEILTLVVRSELILPGPYETVRALSGLIVTDKFWLNVLWTLFRVALGIVISFAAGSACAVLANKNRVVREFLKLPVSFFKSIPVMAIIIYVILIVKADWVAVVVCFFMCFPISYTNILNGLMSLDPKLDELARIYGMTERQKIGLIIRPALQPEIRAAANLITGMSWKVVVASEVLAIPRFSIGYQMLNSKYYLETSDLFAYIVILIILSIVMEKVVSLLVESDLKLTGKRVRKEVAGSTRAGKSTGPVSVRLKNVSKRYVSEDGSEKDVLSGASMEFSQGITALLGPSGIGKTTIMKLITGLEKADSGTVSIVPGSAKPDVLFQEDRLLPWLTARDNMMLAFLNRMPESGDVDEKIDEMAEKLEIKDSLGMVPQELSGGMAHRVALGRALLGGNTLLILDEPMRGLDHDLQERILDDALNDIKVDVRGEGRTVIFITHDEKLAERLSDTIIRI